MSPKVRESLYYAGAIIPSIIGLAIIWGGVSQGVADNINTIIVGVLSLLGAAAPGTAAVTVNRQRKDGTFDPPPPPPPVITGVQAAIEAQQRAQAELDKVKEGVIEAIGVVPGLGPLVQDAIKSVDFQLPTAYGQLFNTQTEPWNR